MPDNCAFYISNPSMLGARYFANFPEIEHFKGKQHGEFATGLILRLKDATLDMNFIEAARLNSHLRSMESWANNVAWGQRDQLAYVLACIRDVTFVIDCNIEPGFDEAGNVEKFVFDFNNGLNGLLVMHNTLFDFDGQPLAGQFYDTFT